MTPSNLKQLDIQPLTKASFAPFGTVIETDGATKIGINQGTTIRFDAMAAVDMAAGDGTPIISLFRGTRRPDPIEIHLLERHPLGSQAFMPLSQYDWLVVVAHGNAAGDAPDFSTLVCFKASGIQGVSYNRGSMSIGESKGGLPPDRLTENEPKILKDCQRVIETHHDADRHAMQRVALAPCSPFSVSLDLMRETAQMARAYDVGLHTHLAENVEDIDYSLASFGMQPGEYIEAVDWVGHDVWHAHCVQLDQGEIDLFARTGTGIAHCPCSNMRLASGIAPVREMLDAGVNIGLGVDGSASNDSGHMLNEARQAMLLQRVMKTGDALTARQSLAIATRGGAAVLGRDDIGQLAPGYAADIAAFDCRGIDFAGAAWDLLAGLLFCGSSKASYTIINGKIIVDQGQLLTMDVPKLLENHHAMTADLMRKVQWA